MRDGIIVVGSMNIDMVVRAERIPGPGENVCGGEFLMVPGGKGANQAVAASRLGKTTFFLTRVGTDYFGDFLIERLTQTAVEQDLVGRTGRAPTGVALIVVERDTGENTIVIYPGANRELSVRDLDSLEPYYARAASALFQCEISADVVREGSRRARERGLVSVLDAGPPRNLDMSLLEHFDIVSPNRDELAELAGVGVPDIRAAVHAARRLKGAGPRTVVVKMGAEGSVLVDDDGAWHFPAYDVRAVDATAAGDAFTAGLAAAVGEGMDVRDAVRFANACGAMAVTVLGAQPSMPDRAEVDRLVMEQSIEEMSL